MALAKRIFLFLTLNFLIVITLMVVVTLFGLKPYLETNGINYWALIVFSLIWGMGGAFISLAMSRIAAKWFMGVLGHEIAHIANGDMVTMTLLQGVVNAFVIFLSRVIAYAIAQVLRERRGQGFSYGIYFIVSFVLQIIFLILGSVLLAWFSRYREYRADQGGAILAGRQKMISALKALQHSYDLVESREHPSASNLKISGHGHGIFRLFSTHPPLEKRIRRLMMAA